MQDEQFKQIKYRGRVVSNLKQHKKESNKFKIDFRVNKKRYRKTFTVIEDSNVNMIQRAIRERDAFIKSKEDSEVNQDAASMTLDEYFTNYVTVTSQAKKWSDKYKYDIQKTYERYIKDIIGKLKVTSIKPSNISEVMDSVSHLSLRSQKQVLEVLQPLFKKAVDRDSIIERSPIKESHLVKRDTAQEKKIVTDAVNKYKIVHSTILDIFKDSPRDRALMLFGFHGRRKGEVITIKWEDIDLKNKVYSIRAENSKVKTTMTFSLADDLYQALKELSKQSNKKGYIFESLKKSGTHITKVDSQVMKLREATGIEDLTYHWLRNLLVSALSTQGVESIHLSAMLGHTDVHTLNKYLSLQHEKASKEVLEASKQLLL